MITLQKSKRRQPAGAVPLEKLEDRQETIEVTVVIRPRASVRERRRAVQTIGRILPLQRKYLNSNQLLKRHGGRARDIAAVEKFARSKNLEVVESNASRRSVILRGSSADVEKAFRVNLRKFQHNTYTYRSFTDQIQLPSTLLGKVEAVLGLDDRPLMFHHAFIPRGLVSRHIQPHEILQAYDFPLGVDGRNQCVAIIELGGGFHQSDIEQYFRRQHMRIPRINVVEIDLQKNDPAPPDLIKKVLDAMGLEPEIKTTEKKNDPEDAARAKWTIESTLDIQLVGSFANGSDIVVYFAPNNAQGKYHALSAALTSKVHPATLISCSWGAPEEDLPEDFVHCMEQLFQDAALKGITICCSSGDRGEDSSNGRPRAHYPASSPHVLGCGGTHWKEGTEKLEEIVWTETFPLGSCQSGGGASKFFKTPSWQKAAKVKLKTGKDGRGLPDVAGKADVKTGYCMYVGGYDVTMGGTSAVAPLWAGLIARFNQKLKKAVGYLTPLLYRASVKHALRDITEGSSGKRYHAWPGWDPCTGLGTPHGKRLLSALKGEKSH